LDVGVQERASPALPAWLVEVHYAALRPLPGSNTHSLFSGLLTAFVDGIEQQFVQFRGRLSQQFLCRIFRELEFLLR
jgi:hypothetical protein